MNMQKKIFKTPMLAIALALSIAFSAIGLASPVTALAGSITIETQPQSITVTASETVEFSVTASGSDALMYQWQYNAAGNWYNLIAETKSTLSFTPSTKVDGYEYRCIITDKKTSSTVTTKSARLTVTRLENELYNNMEFFVNEAGPRLFGTPNEVKTAEYAKAKFIEYGYTDVEMPSIPLNAKSFVGRIAFNNMQDIYGNWYGDTTSFDINADTAVIDMGENTNMITKLPEGVKSKNLIGVVRWNKIPTGASIDSFIAGFKAKFPSRNLVALLISINKGEIIDQTRVRAVDPDTYKNAVKIITITDMAANTILDNAANITKVERYERTTTNAVVAIKHANTDNPDAIIVVTGHMDSAISSPGSSDNASGATAVLELARRFADVNNGNVEIQFAAVGAEEGGGMLGSYSVIKNLGDASKITIDINMDMINSPGGTGKAATGELLNAVSMDINPTPLAFNLPAWLITNTAKNVEWAEGIENVRIYRYGSSDHVPFDKSGIESASMIIATDVDDDIEFENHKSLDNLELNYSLERHEMCVNLMENGIKKAIELTLTKKLQLVADFSTFEIAYTVANANKLFNGVYDKVDLTFTAPNGKTFTQTITKGTTSFTIPRAIYDLTAVAYVTGTADNNNAERNEEYKNFQTSLVIEEVESADVEVVSEDNAETVVNPFVDVTEKDWFYNAVMGVYANELFAGTSTTTFSPKTTMTNGMLIAVLSRFDGPELADISSVFTRDEDLTREQMALMLAYYMQHGEINIPMTLAEPMLYADDSSISEAAHEAVYMMQSCGILNGTGNNNFNPKATVTRAEAAQVIMNLVNAMAE